MGGVYGGGLFLLVYLVLVLTFGFTLLTTDVAIGRRTKQNALNAFGTLHKKWRFLGYLTFLVPTLIMTYYSVIGGWIAKYFAVYLVSDGTQAAQDGFFTSFITSQVSPIIFMLLFLALTAWPADPARPSSACPGCPPPWAARGASSASCSSWPLASRH